MYAVFTDSLLIFYSQITHPYLTLLRRAACTDTRLADTISRFDAAGPDCARHRLEIQGWINPRSSYRLY